jgi:hypothetical protein
MPQVGSMFPVIDGSQVKSGVIPAAAAKLVLAMTKRTPLPEFATLDGTTRSTLDDVPSQLKAVRREFPTMV